VHGIDAPPRNLDDLPLAIEEGCPLHGALRVGIIVKLNLFPSADRHHELGRMLCVCGRCFYPFIGSCHESRMSSCERLTAKCIDKPVRLSASASSVRIRLNAAIVMALMGAGENSE
jgi:hypothetical protein